MIFNRSKRAVYSIISCLILLSGWGIPVFAQPELRSVVMEGNRAFSERRLIDWTGLKIGRPVTGQIVDEAANRLILKLTEEGCYFCVIDSIIRDYSPDSTSIALTFFLNEGERLIFKGLDIAGDSVAVSDRFMPLAQPGKPLYASDLESDLWDILKQREEAGHPFARLDIKGMRLQGDSLSVQAKMTAGPVATLASVRIIGLEHTKPKVIARETRIVPGQLYSPSCVEKARERIRRLPYIDEVSPPALVPLGSNRYDLLFQVKEARSNSFDGVVGYQPGAEGEEGEVTGLLDLSFMNLFGTGRRAMIHWERISEYQQALSLFYEEPWIAGLPFNLWGAFRQEILDSLYLERFVAAGVTVPALDVLSFKGSIFQEEVLPDSSGRVYLGIYKSKEQGGVLEAEYDTRDYIDNPTRGWYYRSMVSASVKDYEAAAGLENVDIRHYETDAEWSHPIIGRQILNLQVHGRYLQSDEDPIPQPDLYRLGGTRSLRGYREDQFLGYVVAWGSVEYRLWLDKQSRLYAFFNQGYYEWTPPTGGTEKKYPWGYGVGFRQGTRIGIIGFDFALGQDDVFSTAKVHFRIINRF